MAGDFWAVSSPAFCVVGSTVPVSSQRLGLARADTGSSVLLPSGWVCSGLPEMVKYAGRDRGSEAEVFPWRYEAAEMMKGKSLESDFCIYQGI